MGKVMDTNHESCGHKWQQIMKPWSFGESRRQKSRKSRTQTILTCQCVCDKSPWQVLDKPVCVTLIEFSPLQCTGKVRDKARDKFTTKSRTWHRHKSWKSATWFVSRTFMICVHDFVANLSRTLSQSLRNGIWALLHILQWQLSFRLLPYSDYFAIVKLQLVCFTILFARLRSNRLTCYTAYFHVIMLQIFGLWVPEKHSYKNGVLYQCSFVYSSALFDQVRIAWCEWEILINI